MDDIRDEVSQDRGAIKKLQLLFPGYHGYRINEDLRDADIYLKDEIYKFMLGLNEKIKSIESNLLAARNYQYLEKIGLMRSSIQETAERIKHHEAGYSGISAPVRITSEKISALYDLDMKIYEALTGIRDTVEQMVLDSITGIFDVNKYSKILESIGGVHDLDSSRNRLLYGGV